MTPKIQHWTMRNFVNWLRKHTSQAKNRWAKLNVHGSGAGWSTPHTGMTVLIEEVGKAARCINKLDLAEDSDIRNQWEIELGHRLVTIASVAERIGEQYAQPPKNQDYYSNGSGQG